ncbi:hypothetical protein NL676_024618 [Syzygium grande]|nr:hypothetical protein NL676_024618 [Syzygium grande]
MERDRHRRAERSNASGEGVVGLENVGPIPSPRQKRNKKKHGEALATWGPGGWPPPPRPPPRGVGEPVRTSGPLGTAPALDRLLLSRRNRIVPFHDGFKLVLCFARSDFWVRDRIEGEV